MNFRRLIFLGNPVYWQFYLGTFLSCLWQLVSGGRCLPRRLSNHVPGEYKNIQTFVKFFISFYKLRIEENLSRMFSFCLRCSTWSTGPCASAPGKNKVGLKISFGRENAFRIRFGGSRVEYFYHRLNICWEVAFSGTAWIDKGRGRGEGKRNPPSPIPILQVISSWLSRLSWLSWS